MKAFVKTNSGTFPDVNFYQAWKGFVELGYEVVLMDNEQKADFTVDTPVFAGTRIFDKVMEKLGVKYERLSTYPEELKDLLFREITLTTLKEAKKQFHGNLWKSFLDLIPLANVPDDAQVIVSELVKFLSEHRAYINDKEIIAVKHYAGPWNAMQPQEETIKEAIKMFKSSPIAYALDFGVIKNKDGMYCDVLVEANDGTSLGNYGLDSIHYVEMLIARWFEIIDKDKNIRSIELELKDNPLPEKLKAIWK